jgi:hypothetical protein
MLPIPPFRRLIVTSLLLFSLPGYATREIPLTEGPMNWIDLHGHNHGEYWLVKSDHFHANLELICSAFTGTVSAASAVNTLLFWLHLVTPLIIAPTSPLC